MSITNNIAEIKRLVAMLPSVFQRAVENIHVVPVFQEAADGDGESGGGVSWHDPNKASNIGGAPQGMQGANNTVNQMLKGMRAASAEFRQDQGVAGMGYHIK